MADFGRRASLRCWWGNPGRFDSCQPHHENYARVADFGRRARFRPWYRKVGRFESCLSHQLAGIRKESCYTYCMPRRASKYTKKFLEPLVASSVSVVDLLRRLGLKPTGGNYGHIQQKVRAHGLCTDHFTGAAWSKGRTQDDHPSLRAVSIQRSTPDYKVFRSGSTYPKSGLAKRLKRIGWDYKCKLCELTDWRGQTITLHVDHVDGDTSNNELVNLRFLCPNCHQQTPTWGAKNRKVRILVDAVQGTTDLDPVLVPGPLCRCGVEIDRRSSSCLKCKSRPQERVTWPGHEELAARVASSSYVAVAQELGVSDNAVRKRLKNH